MVMLIQGLLLVVVAQLEQRQRRELRAIKRDLAP